MAQAACGGVELTRVAARCPVLVCSGNDKVGVTPGVVYSTGSTLFGTSSRPGEDYGKTFANFGEVLRGSKPWQYDSPPHPDFLRPKFSAKSDAVGEVYIDNIPARDLHRVHVFHDKHVVRGQLRPPYWPEISFESKPGLTENITTSMVSNPELTAEMLLPPQPSLFDRFKVWLKKRLVK